jgi:hypothetical protein
MNFSIESISEIGKAVAEEMRRSGYSSGNKLHEVETGMRELLRQAGKAGLAAFLEEEDEALHEEGKRSANNNEYEFHSYRSAVILSVFGRVNIERRYYRYKDAKNREEKGFVRLDQKMGFVAGEVSPSLGELLALEGVSTPFEESGKKIEKFLLIGISDNTVRKETERFGALQAEIERELIENSQDEEWLQKRQREQKTVHPGRIYGSVDGFMVPLRTGWKEFKALAWYNVAKKTRYTAKRHQKKEAGQQSHLQAENITYHCDKLNPEAFGHLFWATGCQRQVDFYEERVFIGDGAKWIWQMIERYYPDATQILDWYHASQYLYKIADEAFEIESEDYDQWIEKVKTLLWEGRIHQLISECERFLDKSATSTVAGAAITFYTNNIDRMDYARFRKEGYFIGSGTIESAAKRLGELRLKVAGARWTRDGAVHTAKARAAWLSQQWEPIVAKRCCRNLPVAV